MSSSLDAALAALNMEVGLTELELKGGGSSSNANANANASGLGVKQQEIHALNQAYNADNSNALRDLNRMNEKLGNTMKDWESTNLNSAAITEMQKTMDVLKQWENGLNPQDRNSAFEGIPQPQKDEDILAMLKNAIGDVEKLAEQTQTPSQQTNTEAYDPFKALEEQMKMLNKAATEEPFRPQY